ncbi:MAG: DUF4126 domain-containing protein [Burkholderiales bacterium]|nr:DUF4126 domain-containing protein [Burkholderiales bacterium]
MDPLTLSLITGLGWTSGLRFYAVVFCLGLLQHSGMYVLPGDLELLAHPWVIGISGLLFLTEFFADKVPGVDTLWDALHTFIRIPGGALLAAAAVAGGDPGLAWAAALLGGTAAAGAHFAKAGSRALINTSPEPFSNWLASFTEDTLALGALWVAFKYPLLFLALFTLFVLAALWLLPKLWRGVLRIAAALRGLGGAPRR